MSCTSCRTLITELSLWGGHNVCVVTNIKLTSDTSLLRHRFRARASSHGCCMSVSAPPFIHLPRTANCRD